MFGSLINLKNHGKQLIAPWPHTADMDLPTTWLKVVDHPVRGMLCTLCKKYKKVPRIFKMIFQVKQMGGVNGCGLLWALHKNPVGNTVLITRRICTKFHQCTMYIIHNTWITQYIIYMYNCNYSGSKATSGNSRYTWGDFVCTTQWCSGDENILSW